MISKEEVLYGQLAVHSGFIAEADLIGAIEAKRDLVLQAQQSENGERTATLPEILRGRGLIGDDEDAFLEEKLAGRAPKTFGDGAYEVVKKLGQGAMGAVYKARQVSMNRLVAIKLLSRQLAGNKKFVARFEREARMVGQLNHPNIVAGIDSGREDGVYYYVMEYVEGRELDKIIDESGRLEEARALDYGLQLARALEHAHQHNMVHRDIKPENVLITEEGVAKLCDLGLAKPEDDQAGLTLAGSSMGTPHYISPEQAQGLSDRIDIRSDIYSLGVTLWHCLVGDVPFRADSPAMVLTAHIDEPLPDPKKLAPQLSLPTCALLRRMLAKSSDDRQKNPTELIADIEAALAGQPLPQRKAARPAGPRATVAPPRKQPGATSRVVRRRPSRVIAPPARPRGNNNLTIGLAAGGALLALILIVVAATRGGNPDETPATGKPGKPAAGRGKVDDGAAEAARQALLAARSQMGFVREFEKKHPTDYLGAIRQYEKLLEQYAAHPLAAAEIKQRIADIKRKAEGEVSRLRLALDAEVTRLLGLDRLGQAYDRLAAFPAYLEFTDGARDLLAQRKELFAKLEQRWKALLAEVRPLLAGQRIAEVLALYRKSIEQFDAARRSELRERIRALEQKLRDARDATLRKLHGELERLRPQIEAAFKQRSYRTAQQLVGPLAHLAAPYPAEPSLEPLRTLQWDLELLLVLQSAIEAAYRKHDPGKLPALLPHKAYLALAEKGRTSGDLRWPLVLAVFCFFENRLDIAEQRMAEAEQATLDVAPLRKRLVPMLGPWREEQARIAFEELEGTVAGMNWDNATDRKGLWLSIKDFEQRHGKTEFARSKADVIAGWKARLSGGPPPKQQPVKIKLEDFPKHLNGKVLKWNPKKLYIKLVYSFKDKRQLKDWKPGAGGRGPGQGRQGQGSGTWELNNGWVSGGGLTGYYHIVQFKDRVALTCQAISTNPRTCGISLHVENALRRYFFGFNMQLPRQRIGGYIGLMDGRQMPKILDRSGRWLNENQLYLLKAQAAAGQLTLFVDGKLLLQAVDKTLNKGRVGFDAFNSNCSFRNVLIEGIVDRPWLEKFLEQRAGGEQKKTD